MELVLLWGDLVVTNVGSNLETTIVCGAVLLMVFWCVGKDLPSIKNGNGIKNRLVNDIYTITVFC